jgi:hypothetical protein
MVTVP